MARAEGAPVRDKLTGLYEKRYFLEHLDLEVQRCERYGRPLAVLLVEFQYDWFSGDPDLRWSLGYTLFKQLGPILRGTLRRVDMACRYEGDQAVAFLPETGAEGARVAAERIRSRVEVHEFLGGEPAERLRLAVNVGVALFPDHGSSGRSLVASAGEAVRQAREEGGNRVVVLARAEAPAAPEEEAATDAPDSWDGLARQQSPGA